MCGSEKKWVCKIKKVGSYIKKKKLHKSMGMAYHKKSVLR